VNSCHNEATLSDRKHQYCLISGAVAKIRELEPQHWKKERVKWQERTTIISVSTGSFSKMSEVGVIALRSTDLSEKDGTSLKSTNLSKEGVIALKSVNSSEKGVAALKSANSSKKGVAALKSANALEKGVATLKLAKWYLTSILGSFSTSMN
jgi:hypothetical protein